MTIKFNMFLMARITKVWGLVGFIVFVTLLAPLQASFGAGMSQGKQADKIASLYHIPLIKTHRMTSQVTGLTYEIQVMVPVSKKDGSEKFPVLYMTDANGGIPISQITQNMQVLAELPRFIVVGIGYPVDNIFQSLYLRQRDLTPSDMKRARYPIPLEGMVEVTSGKKMGGAPEFLAFIRDELKPFINAHYKTVPEDSGYFGHSLGGLFGLYVLFHKPDTFSRYVIGSPAIWWDNDDMLSQAQNFLDRNDDLNAYVYMAVGGMEERLTPSKHYVSNVYKMDALLRRKPLSGFHLRTEVFPTEGHASVFGLLHSRGLRAVYGPVKCGPFRPEDCP